MLNKSDVTGLEYHAEDMCFFRNYIQAAYYCSWGAKLWDIFVDSKNKWVFVFSKEDHLKYRDRWGMKASKDLEE
jgi:hypothetical protein